MTAVGVGSYSLRTMVGCESVRARYNSFPLQLFGSCFVIPGRAAHFFVIPGRAQREPGIHSHHRLLRVALSSQLRPTSASVVMDSGLGA
jgi:hypothetical protein